jgi:hypothetical protein
VEAFTSINSPAQAGEWVATMRQTLEQEIDPATWAEVAREELRRRQTEEPPDVR